LQIASFVTLLECALKVPGTILPDLKASRSSEVQNLGVTVTGLYGVGVQLGLVEWHSRAGAGAL
jgi:hypothetical protein